MNKIDFEGYTKKCSELPLFFPSPLRYSLHISITLSIILSNKMAFEWFYSNFIQLSFDNEYENNNGNHPLNIYPALFTRGGQNGASLVINDIMIYDNIIPLVENELISNIIKWIDNGYYVNSEMDVTKLPNTRYYKSEPFLHGCTCFGYDKGKQVLKLIDFDNLQNLSIIEVSYMDYTRAFYSEEPQNSKYKNKAINLRKLKENFQFDLDIYSIKELIFDYLNSINTSKKYNFIIPEVYNNTWGISVYESLIDFLKKSKKGNYSGPLTESM